MSNKEPKSFKHIFIGDEIQTLNFKKLFRILKLSLSEICGTAILVSLGCMSTKDMSGNPISDLNIAVSFAFAITISVMTFGHVSGSLINPAMSLVGLVMGKLSIQMCIVYIISQCIGATFGYIITRSLYPQEFLGDAFCCTFPNKKIELHQAFTAEFILTGMLALALCGAWDKKSLDKHDSMPLKFGCAVVALIVPGAQFAGCSINPARSFGPALITGRWEYHWMYWIAPTSGALTTSIIYKIIFYDDPNKYQLVKTEESQPA